MKKNGFTLIEILGVIVILGLISALIYPVINNVLNDNKQKLYDKQISNLEKIAYNWSIENTEILPKEGTYFLSFGKLQEDGYIKESDVKNPLTDNDLTGCIQIKWSNGSKQFIFEYIDNCS